MYAKTVQPAGCTLSGKHSNFLQGNSSLSVLKICTVLCIGSQTVAAGPQVRYPHFSKETNTSAEE